MSLQDELWAALNRLSKPITEEAVLAKAKEVLPGKQYADFEKWMGINSRYLMGRLNA